jgi:transcriptional regulator with XRE-family HTH domain
VRPPLPGLSLNIAFLYYRGVVVTGDLIKEARLRAGLTQVELGRRLDKPQSVIARWARDEVAPSLETVRGIVRACGLELTFSLSRFDDSNFTIIDDNLRMTPEQRFAVLMERIDFQDIHLESVRQ